MAEDKPKIKMAVYWGAACGGCCKVCTCIRTPFTEKGHNFWIEFHKNLLPEKL